MSGTILPGIETWVDCDEERAALRAENERLTASNARLVAALRPFAVPNKTSLIETLGHIGREHIANARTAVAEAEEKQRS